MNGSVSLLLLVHEAGTVAACLRYLHAVLVAELVGLLNELLHLLHDGLILLLILLLVGLLRLLVAGRIVRRLLLWLLRGLVPWVGNFVATCVLSAPGLLLGLAGSFF